uniref:SUI1 domain-containing protein n=1 Tax=Spongospora subterranea TaxID=70186 RepID=A0A0H5QFD2_9EUKA|eukprot:CRZ00753.1 hypothetical protein [Spongospora subterranea]
MWSTRSHRRLLSKLAVEPALPFQVSRTVLGTLPVYLEHRSGRGNSLKALSTVIRMVRGDSAMFEAVLKKEFGPIIITRGGKTPSGAEVHIVGNWREECVDLLSRMGF